MKMRMKISSGDNLFYFSIRLAANNVRINLNTMLKIIVGIVGEKV